MPDTFATSFGVLNYSGMLFNKGNVRTPLSSAIGGKRLSTNHVEFVTGQEYATVGGSQPAISENASLTAPDASVITRAQNTNVTQIFHEAVGISYAKEANMGTLSGVNVAGQQANPMNELDFQVAGKMAKIARDIEYTFVNGVYQKADNDSTANKTRGLVNAIESNVRPMAGAALGFWDVAEMAQMIYNSQAPTEGLVIWCDGNTMMQLNADAASNGMTIVPAAREVNGIALSSVVTPFGVVYLRVGEFLPAGTAFLLNLDYIRPVEQPTPGKGNFFLEELAKTGAGTKYQIFGQIGLDYGPEWFHGMWTGLSTSFAKPVGKKVYAVSQAPSVTLNKSSVSVASAATTSLSATVVPGGSTVTWVSSDTSVATVSSAGVVTGVAAGNANVMATIVVDNAAYSANCAVTVTAGA